jgi:hypothetical protein
VIHTLPAPCWAPIYDREDSEAARYCYPTADIAAQAARRSDLPAAVMEPADHACVTITCNTCGATSDDEHLGPGLHFPTARVAGEWARDAGWSIAGYDATCPDCRPADTRDNADHAWQPWPDLFDGGRS